MSSVDDTNQQQTVQGGSDGDHDGDSGVDVSVETTLIKKTLARMNRKSLWLKSTPSWSAKLSEHGPKLPPPMQRQNTKGSFPLVLLPQLHVLVYSAINCLTNLQYLIVCWSDDDSLILLVYM